MWGVRVRVGVTQTRPLFRLANLFRNIILHTKTKCKKLVVAYRNINNNFDHSFGMLAVSFQLLTWCTNSAEDLIFFTNVDQDS